MLSRVADSLYWIGRYLERAEHTARMVDVQRQPRRSTARPSRRAATGIASSRASRRRCRTRHSATRWRSRRSAHASIPATRTRSPRCILGARENAAADPRADQLRDVGAGQPALLDSAKQTVGRRLLAGPAAGVPQAASSRAAISSRGSPTPTMNRGEGYHFIQLGRFVERAFANSALLGVPLPRVPRHGARGGPARERRRVGRAAALVHGVRGLLAALHGAPRRRGSIADFLLLDPEFPRSIRFAVRADRELAARDHAPERPGERRPARAAGRAAAGLALLRAARRDHRRQPPDLPRRPSAGSAARSTPRPTRPSSAITSIRRSSEPAPCTTPSATSPASPTTRPISESVMEVRMQPRTELAPALPALRAARRCRGPTSTPIATRSATSSITSTSRAGTVSSSSRRRDRRVRRHARPARRRCRSRPGARSTRWSSPARSLGLSRAERADARDAAAQAVRRDAVGLSRQRDPLSAVLRDLRTPSTRRFTYRQQVTDGRLADRPCARERAKACARTSRT